jgi:hypothetical protein
MSDQPEPRVLEPWSYSGEVWTDAAGRAVVVLPSFARVHRVGFQYELTALGQQAHARVVETVRDDRFTIATNQAHVKVAWRITPLRERST